MLLIEEVLFPLPPFTVGPAVKQSCSATRCDSASATSPHASGLACERSTSGKPDRRTSLRCHTCKKCWTPALARASDEVKARFAAATRADVPEHEPAQPSGPRLRGAILLDTVDKLADRIQRGALADIAGELVARHGGEWLLIVVDQLEEVFNQPAAEQAASGVRCAPRSLRRRGYRFWSPCRTVSSGRRSSVARSASWQGVGLR